MTKNTLSLPIVAKKREESERVYSLCSKHIPGGVNSPVRAFRGLDIPPLIVAYGKGDRIVDVDNHSYIDYCGSWGALVHGHAPPTVVEKIIQKVRLGTTFGATTEVEGILAQKVTQHLPSIEKIRFVSSGTEATMSALRLARAFTGKKLILKFEGNYHGHSDALLTRAGSGLIENSPTATSAGVPPEAISHTLTLPYNDLEKTRSLIRKIGRDLAAIILEPIAANMGVTPPLPGFLEMLREESQRCSTLLIFDEVITGFRVGIKGAQGLYQITPDITCLGKIVGGGLPAAAFGGRAEIMDLLAPDGPVYQAGTLSGNPCAMEAGLEALRLLERPNFYQNLEEKTRELLEPIELVIRQRDLPLAIQRVGSMFTLFFGSKKVVRFEPSLDIAQYREFFRFLFERGIYFAPSQYEANFISAAHTLDSLHYTRDTILEYVQSHY